MKVWSTLFTSAVIAIGVAACAMDPQPQPQGQQQGGEENVGHVSQAICRTGTTCYDGSSSGTTVTTKTFTCPLSLPKGGCGLRLVHPLDDSGHPILDEYICEHACDGSGDGYGTYYNPCPLFQLYSCTPWGYCFCHP